MTFLNMNLVIRVFKRTVLSVVLLFSLPLSATLIEYELTHLGGSSYQYDYTVTNDTLAIDIEEFVIYFDEALTESLAIVATPAGWDPLIIQPDPGLPDVGFYDALALVSGIAPGGSLGVFSVSFDWIGGSSTGPGDQFFEILDPFTFDVLDSGSTSAVPGTPPPSVPEPSTVSLLLLWMAGIMLGKRRIRVNS